MHAVSKAILDIAFAKEQPPFALNLVHPRSVAWNDVVLPIGQAIIRQRKLPGSSLRVVPFPEWFSILEELAKSATNDELKSIVSMAAVDASEVF